VSGTRSWGQAAAGRRPGFGLTAADLLEKAEQYERSTHEPTQGGFLRTAQIRTTRTEDGHTLSEHQLRTWRKGYAMDYPLVPAIDDQRRPIIVHLIDVAGTLLWISANVRDVLGFERWELVGRAAVEALSAGRDPHQTDPQLCADFRALRDGTLAHAAPPPAHMVHRDGHLVPVQLRAGYGERSHAWYTQATVLSSVDTTVKAAADRDGHVRLTLDDYVRALPDYVPPGPTTRDEQTFNVEPYLIRPPALIVKRELHGINVGRERLNGSVLNGTLTHTIIKPAPGELERYMAELADAAQRDMDERKADA